LIGHAQFYISQRRRYNIRPYINDKYNPICNSDVPISNELFENDCHKRIKELGDPIKIPIGAHSYPSYRYGRGGYRGGRLSFRCPESRREGGGRGGRKHLLFHQRNPGYTPVPKRRNYLSPNHKFHY
jgi:hypothetical protein